MFRRSLYLSCIYALSLFIPTIVQAEKPQFFSNNEQATTMGPEIKSLQLLQQDMFAQQIDKIKNQVQNLIFCIEQVVRTLGAKKIKIEKKDAEKVSVVLQNIKHSLQNMYAGGLEPHPNVIAANSYLVAYITLFLNESFLNITTISIEKFNKSMQIALKKIQDMDFADADGYQKVEKRLEKNTVQIKKLIKRAETLGLNKINLIWRKFEKSKWTDRAKKFITYTVIGLATNAALMTLLPKNTRTYRLGFANNSWWPAIRKSRAKFSNFHMESISNVIWAEREAGIANFLNNNLQTATNFCAEKRERLHAAQNAELSSEIIEVLKSEYLGAQLNLNKIYESINNPASETTLAGVANVMNRINPLTAVLLASCGPLASYVKGIWSKIVGSLDTTQDYAQVEKWASEKIKNALAYLRGETTYQYIGSDFNSNEERVTLDDIIGQEYLKEIALELADFIKNPERYERAQIKAEAGILLYGPPQTGKTMFAKALQTLLKDEVPGDRVAFIPVTNKDLEQFTVEEMFYLAGRNAPCVLFIDEIEMIGAKRDGAGGQRTRELLTCINGLSSANISKNVFVIGATNKPEDLDFALTVKGRFGIQIPLSYPIYKNRLEYIQRQFATRGVNHLSEEFIQQMAEETEGNSFNDLLSIINDAFARAMRELRAVTKRDFELAFDKQIRNILPLSTLTAKERDIIATYQVGLGLSRHLLKTGIKTTCLTINPVKQKIRYNDTAFSFKDSSSNKDQNDQLLPVENKDLIVNGYTFTTSSKNTSIFSSDNEAEKEILVLLAGQAALKVIFGESFSNYMPEHKAECLNKIKSFLSDGEKNTDDIIKEALRLKSTYEKQILELLTPHKEAIQELAETLVEKKIIRTEEWQELLEEIVNQ